PFPPLAGSAPPQTRSPHRIKMHIATQPQEMIALLHQKTLVAALKQMTARMMPPVKIHRVGNQQPMHPLPQIGPMRLRHQMKMVGHQNKAQNRRIKTLRRLAKQLHEASAISLVVKYRLTRIAPATQVIDRTFKFYAQRSSHALHIANRQTNVKCLDLTPSPFTMRILLAHQNPKRSAAAAVALPEYVTRLQLHPCF